MPTMCLALEYEDDLDRVLTRIFFILLSQHFQLVYVSLNGAIVLEGGALKQRGP